MRRYQAPKQEQEIPSQLLKALQAASSSSAPIYIDEKRASFLTGYSRAFFRKRRLLENGPPYRKIGRSVRYNVLELLKWIEAQACYPLQCSAHE